jgi:hypothetical protein
MSIMVNRARIAQVSILVGRRIDLNLIIDFFSRLKDEKKAKFENSFNRNSSKTAQCFQKFIEAFYQT